MPRNSSHRQAKVALSIKEVILLIIIKKKMGEVERRDESLRDQGTTDVTDRNMTS